MKKLLSCLLLAAMFLSLSLTGAWSGRALAEAPADQAGAEDAVGVWIGLVDMLPILEEEDAPTDFGVPDDERTLIWPNTWAPFLPA